MNIFLLKKKLLSLFITLLLFISPNAHSVEFEFNVTIDKQTCKLSVFGTSHNEVDFGSIQSNKIKNNLIDPIPIKVLLTDCKTNDFSDTYVTVNAKSSLNSVTFNDDIKKSFGVRLSNKNSVAQSNLNSDFFKSGDKIWDNINKDQLEKTLYTYIKCKDATSCDPEVGKFSATLTFSYIVD
ncbi:TPA: type 1 fimbrial protein [Proteus mirabilis]|nr:type 1 fimbrial protein [Proteus mirabilis]